MFLLMLNFIDSDEKVDYDIEHPENFSPKFDAFLEGIAIKCYKTCVVEILWMVQKQISNVTEVC